MTQAQDTKAPGPDHRLLADLRLCESAVWDALVQGNQHADSAALADSFLGVYSDGFSGKTEHVQQLANGPVVQTYALSGMRVLPVGGNHALLAYRADFDRGGPEGPEAMYVSSIWQRTDDGWINIFSQDTPATAQT